MRMSLALLLTLAAAPVAHADSKAWTAAKKLLPANEPIVAGVNASAARSSKLYQQVLPMLMGQLGKATDQLDALKKQCNIDALEVVDSVALAVDDSGTGAFVVALKGTTRKDFEACGQKIAGGKPLATKTDGSFTVYSFDGKDLYVKWVSDAVFAISTSPDDKAASAKLLGGGIDKDKALSAKIASINTSAVVWGVLAKQQQLDDQTKMTGAYGSVNLAKGNVDANVHVVISDAKAASAFVTKANQQLADARAQKPPPTGALADVLKAVVVKSTGSEAVVTAAFPEADVFELVGMAAGALH